MPAWASRSAAAESPAKSQEPPAKQLEALNAALSSQKGSPADFAALAEQLLNQWASAEPQEAMRYALNDDNVHDVFLRAAGNVMEAWARRDPVAARTFFEGLDAMQAGLVAPSLLQGYGSKAPESALEWVHAGAMPEELRSILARSVVGVYESARRREEIKLWLTLPGVAESPGGTSAAADLARRIARANPQAALEFCRGLPADSPARLEAMQFAVRQWASGDPGACGAWVTGLREKQTAAKSPNDNFSEKDLDHATAGLIVGTARNVSGAALDAIRDPSLRKLVSQALHNQP